MTTQEQRAEAREILHVLGEKLPASLRAPLLAVRDGTNKPGTADSVLAVARQALDAAEVQMLERWRAALR